MSSNNLVETMSGEQSSVSPINGDRSAIAHAQWKCIEQLASQYSNKSIKGTNNKFEDDKWIDSDSRKTISWSTIDDNDNRQALVLLLKIGAYHQIESRQNKIWTVNTAISALMVLFKGALKNRRVLVGHKNEFLLGFDEISTIDLNQAIDVRIVSGYSIGNTMISALDLVKKIPAHAINNLSIYTANYDYPWKEKGLSNWVNERHSDLEIALPEIKPYLSMLPGTTQPLIEHSMDMIENYGEKILAIHSKAIEFGELNYKPFFYSDYGVTFIKSFSDTFEHLIPIVIITGTYTETISVSWFYRIVDLLRAACINIILLTTGLRNFDLRSLKIGCCKPSGRVDMLNYIDSDISKTGIRMLLPVPDQTRKAIDLLERLRLDDSYPYVISPSNRVRSSNQSDARVQSNTINSLLSNFAKHFDIPFVIAERDDDEYTAHCYRATVAGWLDSASNLSILLIKRLFGHTNSMMPLAYLHHNPNFIKARMESLEQASEVMSARMAEGAEQHLLSGKRGEDLIRGFEGYQSENNLSSESLSDKELFTTFQARIKERIMSGSMYAMMTPFGVICTRNPNDSTPTPCAKLSDRDKLKESEINKEVWDYMQARPNPGQCIGKTCEHAMLGPWSTAIKDSFSWYVDFLAGRNGQELTTEELREEAKAFVKQYAPDMQKIFGMVTSND